MGTMGTQRQGFRKAATMVVTSALASTLCWKTQDSSCRGEDRRNGTGSAAGWSVDVNLIARLSPNDLYLAFGDSDHDGRQEVFFRWVDSNYVASYRIHELQAPGVFTEEYRGANLVAQAVADLDEDGKSEVIGYGPNNRVYIYESTSPSTYPSQLVWSSPGWFAGVGDTDRDGNQELLVLQAGPSPLGAYLVVFENTGDDLYILKGRPS